MEGKLEGDRGHLPKTCEAFTEGEESGCSTVGWAVLPDWNHGETKDKSVSQISHLKYIPPQMRALTAKERNVRRKAGLINKGYKMHIGLLPRPNVQQEGKIVHDWQVEPHVGQWRFWRTFSYFGKKNGKEETQSNVLVVHRKWIPVPVSESSNQEVACELVAGVRVQYQQAEDKTCLFHSLASAFHYLGQKHTGSVLASMARKLCNLPAEAQLDKAIKIVKNHDTVYKKVVY